MENNSDVRVTTVICWFFSNLELVPAQSNWSRPLMIQLDLHECLMDELSMSEGQKLHPQILLVLPFCEHASYEEACDLDMLVQSGNDLTLSCLQSPFPESLTTVTLHSSVYSALTLREVELRFILPYIFLCCKSQHLAHYISSKQTRLSNTFIVRSLGITSFPYLINICYEPVVLLLIK